MTNFHHLRKVWLCAARPKSSSGYVCLSPGAQLQISCLNGRATVRPDATRCGAACTCRRRRCLMGPLRHAQVPIIAITSPDPFATIIHSRGRHGLLFVPSAVGFVSPRPRWKASGVSRGCCLVHSIYPYRCFRASRAGTASVSAV